MVNEDYREDILEEEQQGFVVDSAEKANYALRKIKDMRAEKDFFIKSAKDEIKKIQESMTKEEEKCKRGCDFFIWKLNEYLDTDVPVKKTKTQISLNLPMGKIIRKLPTLEIIDGDGNTGVKLKTNDELIKFVEESDSEYIENSKTVKWGEFKKILQVTEEGDVMTKDGEIIDCLSAIEVPAKCDVKLED